MVLIATNIYIIFNLFYRFNIEDEPIFRICPFRWGNFSNRSWL